MNPKTRAFSEKIKEINTLLLAIRYRDTLSLLKSENTQSEKLVGLAKALLLGYGSTHSSYGAGFYVDRYHRDASVQSDSKNMLFTQATSAVGSYLDYIPFFKKNIPINSSNITKNLLKTIFPSDNINEISVNGKKIPVLAIAKNTTNLEKLKYYGLLPTRDKQLWIAANSSDFKELFTQSFKNLAPDLSLESFIKNLPYQASSHDAKEINNQILKNIKAALQNKYEGQQVFYLSVLEKLINHLKQPNIDVTNEEKEQFRLALSRLQFIIEKAIASANNNYYEFLTYLHFAFDEIKFLNTITHPYQDVKKVISEFIQQYYTSDIFKPEVFLGGSGVNSLAMLIFSAIENCRASKNFNKGKIYLQGSVYFEIKWILSYMSGDKSFSPCLTFDKDKMKPIEFSKTEIFDVVICGFHENISRKEYFGSEDVEKLIQKQFENRKNSGSEQPLIVVIDTTLSAFDEVQMSHILTVYENEILSGKLAITTSHSFNKYFHLGFDTLSAGLGTGYFNPVYFPELSKTFNENTLGDFSANDPTPQMLAHFITYAGSHIIEFYNIIKGAARYVHDELIPFELMNYPIKPRYITVHSPLTRDIYNETWGFVVFDVQTPNKLLTLVLFRDLINICMHNNIIDRMGYGYGHSSFTNFDIGESKILRISLGTESKAELKNAFQSLIDYVTKVNEISAQFSEQMPSRCQSELLELSSHLNKQITESKKTQVPITSAVISKILSTTVAAVTVISDKKTSYYYNKAIELEKKAMQDHSLKTKSMEYFLNAAKLGHREAEYKVGIYFESVADNQEAFRWYKIASLHDHLNATYKVGSCYAKGIGTHRNYTKAAIYFTKAAEQNHTDAIYSLAQLYQKGLGPEQDLKTAINLYHKIVDKGHAKAEFELGFCYQYGNGVTLNLIKAEEFYLKAVKLGHSTAAYQLGLLYEEKQEYKKAFEYYQIGADGHDPMAEYKLGLIYEKGEIGPPDEIEAFKYFKLAANQNNIEAQFKLGNCYEFGKGVEKDLRKAQACYAAAAKKGHKKSETASHNLRFKQDIIRRKYR